MEKPLKILLLEDNSTDAEIIQQLLLKEKKNCEFCLAPNKKEFIQALDEFLPEVILSDNSMPHFNAIEALQITRQRFIHIPFILITATVSEEYAATIIKQGADDYILKDRMARLPAAIDAAIKQRKSLKEIIDYKYALDQSSIVAITDQQGTIIYANENFCAISKYTVNELVGQDHRIVNSGYHPASYIKKLWVTIANGKIWRGEICNRAKDGSIYWVDTTIIPFLNEKEKPYQYLAIRIDITERKTMEQDLRKSHERFKYVTQATSDIIWELNFETKQYIVHEGKEKLFENNKVLNWQPGEDGNYITEEHRERVSNSFTGAIKDAKRKLWIEEYQVFAAGNDVLYIINHAVFIRDENGNAIRAIGAITDITEKKNLEKGLIDQYRREQLKITATALDAQEKERNAIGEELHDNVNQILVGANLLLSMVHGSSKKSRELVVSCMNHLQNAIKENRKIAHLLVAPDFENNSLSDQLLYLTDNMLKVKGVTVSIDATGFREELLDEPKKLAIYRIAQEQCANIVKYAEAQRVNIFLSTIAGLFEMKISDDGRGMEKGIKTNGIGLRNIKGRLSIFNGTANIITSPGKGFTLEIAIPC